MTLPPNPPASAKPVVMDVATLQSFLSNYLPESDLSHFVLESVGPMSARLRMPFHQRHLRLGGTISGPAMFAVADVAIYMAILAQLGPAAAFTVTKNLNINFLLKPAARDVIAECRLMKLGKRLCVGEAWLYSDGQDDPVAHATGTYSIPPRAIAGP